MLLAMQFAGSGYGSKASLLWGILCQMKNFAEFGTDNFVTLKRLLMELARQLVARQDITAVDTTEEETTTEKSTMEDSAEDLESG